MKRILSILLAVCLLVGALPLSAFAATVTGEPGKEYNDNVVTGTIGAGADAIPFTYYVNGDKAGQLKLTPSEMIAATSLTVPNTVTDGTNTYNVVSVAGPSSSWYSMATNYLEPLVTLVLEEGIQEIADYSFFDCHLTSVTLPSTLTSIGYRAFENAPFTSITLPAGLTALKANAFRDCANLTTINIAGLTHLTEIGNYCFGGCNAMTSITLPDSVTDLGKGVFYQATGLTSVTLPAGLAAIPEDTFSGCTALTSFTFPAAVTSIGINAFSSSGLTSIVIPDRVTSIGSSAFRSCASLASVTLPTGLTSMGDYSFTSCTALESIDLSRCTSLTNTGDNTFCWTGLTSVTIPGFIKTVGNGAFLHCRDLASVTLSEGVETLRYSAFEDTAITEITIPASLTSIAPYYTISSGGSFASCEKLTTVNFAPNGKLTTITGFEDCVALEDSVVKDLPANITVIGDSAFKYCTNFKNIVIPSHITQIGYDAFYRTSYVESITFAPDSQLTTVGNYAFYYAGPSTLELPASVTTLQTIAGEEDDYTLIIRNPDAVVGSASYNSYVTDRDNNKHYLPVDLYAERVNIYAYQLDSAKNPSYFAQLPAAMEFYRPEHTWTFHWLEEGEPELPDQPDPHDVTITVPAEAEVALQCDGTAVRLTETAGSGTATYTAEGLLPETEVVIRAELEGHYPYLRVIPANLFTEDVAIDLTSDGFVPIAGTKTLRVTFDPDSGVSSFTDLESYTLKKGSDTLEKDTDYTITEGADGSILIALVGDTLLADTFTLEATPNESFKCSKGTASTTADKGVLALSFPAWGKLTVANTSDLDARVLVFGSDGKLVCSGYSNLLGSFATGKLKAGSYTVVAFQENNYVNSSATLSGLADMGLTETTDYVKRTVTVADGGTTEVSLAVPAISGLEQKIQAKVDVEASGIRMYDREIYLGSPVRAYLWYTLKEAPAGGAAITVTLPDRAEIKGVSTDKAKLTAGSDYTVSGSTVTLTTTEQSGKFFLDFEPKATGEISLSASIGVGGTSVPLGSDTSRVIDAITIEDTLMGVPLNGPYCITVYAMARRELVLTVDNGEHVNTYESGLMPMTCRHTFEVTMPEGTVAGDIVSITVSTKDGAHTVRKPAYVVGNPITLKSLRFTQAGNSYTVFGENAKNSYMLYFHNYSGTLGNAALRKYWSFTAELEAEEGVTPRDVMVTLTMKDGSTRVKVPMWETGVKDNIHTFSGLYYQADLAEEDYWPRLWQIPVVFEIGWTDPIEDTYNNEDFKLDVDLTYVEQRIRWKGLDDAMAELDGLELDEEDNIPWEEDFYVDWTEIWTEDFLTELFVDDEYGWDDYSEEEQAIFKEAAEQVFHAEEILAVVEAKGKHDKETSNFSMYNSDQVMDNVKEMAAASAEESASEEKKAKKDKADAQAALPQATQDLTDAQAATGEALTAKQDAEQALQTANALPDDDPGKVEAVAAAQRAKEQAEADYEKAQNDEVAAGKAKTRLENIIKQADETIKRAQKEREEAEEAARKAEETKKHMQELICRGWFLPPNTYDCGSLVVKDELAVMGKE